MATFIEIVIPILRTLVDDKNIATDPITEIWSCIKRSLYSNTTEELRTLISQYSRGSKELQPTGLQTVGLTSLLLSSMLWKNYTNLEIVERLLPGYIASPEFGLKPEDVEELTNLLKKFITDIIGHLTNATEGSDSVVANTLLLVKSGTIDWNHIDKGNVLSNNPVTMVGRAILIKLAIITRSTELLAAMFEAGYDIEDVSDVKPEEIIPAEEFHDSSFLTGLMNGLLNKDILVALLENDNSDGQNLELINILCRYHPNISTESLSKLWQAPVVAPADQGKVERSEILKLLGSARALDFHNLIHQVPILDVANVVKDPESGLISEVISEDQDSTAVASSSVPERTATVITKPSEPVDDPVILRLCEHIVDGQTHLGRTWDEIVVQLHPRLDPELLSQWQRGHYITINQRKAMIMLQHELNSKAGHAKVRFVNITTGKNSGLGYQIYQGYLQLYSSWADTSVRLEQRRADVFRELCSKDRPINTLKYQENDGGQLTITQLLSIHNGDHQELADKIQHYIELYSQ